MRLKALFVSLLIALTIPSITAFAKEPEPSKCWLTCYLPTGNPTASGYMPKYGMIAAKNSWMGKTVAVYKRNEDNTMGEFIDYYEVRDRGGTDAIHEGRVIDVFVENEADIIPTQKVYIYLIDAEG